MADKRKILTINNIAEVGLARFPADNYQVSPKVEAPDAIIVRSHNMHDMDIPASVKANVSDRTSPAVFFVFIGRSAGSCSAGAYQTHQPPSKRRRFRQRDASSEIEPAEMCGVPRISTRPSRRPACTAVIG